MFSPSDITLYVPYYNAGKTISRCIDSLASQTITPNEILIIDDGSLQPLPKNLNCRVVEHGNNKGLSAARNTAIRASKTKLIAAVDADVVADHEWLETMLNSLNSTGAAGVGGKMTEHYQESLGDRWRSIHMSQHWGAGFIENPRFLFGANTLFIKDELQNAGLYNEALRTNNEDRTISDLLYEAGRKLIYEPKAKCYHLRKDSTTSILSGFWGWHHAKGLIEGDFKSVEGLISRIDRVNFGISNYRYNLDKEQGRDDFLILDLLIPYVFCCKDILFYCQLNDCSVPDLSALSKRFGSQILEEFIPEYESSKVPNVWFGKYLQIFNENCERFMTVDSLKNLDFLSCLSENISRVFEKR